MLIMYYCTAVLFYLIKFLFYIFQSLTTKEDPLKAKLNTCNACLVLKVSLAKWVYVKT